MDRGYPSTAAFIRMMEKGILFLARLKSSDYKKEQAVMAAPGDGYWAENGGTWACYPTYGKSAAARQ